MGKNGRQRVGVPLTDAELLEYSRTHLHYEVAMLFNTRGLMLAREAALKQASGIELADRQIELNAAVESFALHVRSLIVFLDPGPNGPQPDDVTAKDFLANPADWSPPARERFAKAREQANKQVAHLTKRRIDGYHPDKEWDPELADQLAAVLEEFAGKASPQKLHERFRLLLESLTHVRHEDDEPQATASCDSGDSG